MFGNTNAIYIGDITELGSFTMATPTGKDAMIHMLLELLKEEREKRKDAEASLETSKLLLDELYAAHDKTKMKKKPPPAKWFHHHQGRGIIECDCEESGGEDIIDSLLPVTDHSPQPPATT